MRQSASGRGRWHGRGKEDSHKSAWASGGRVWGWNLVRGKEIALAATARRKKGGMNGHDGPDSVRSDLGASQDEHLRPPYLTPVRSIDHRRTEQRHTRTELARTARSEN